MFVGAQAHVHAPGPSQLVSSADEDMLSHLALRAAGLAWSGVYTCECCSLSTQ